MFYLETVKNNEATLDQFDVCEFREVENFEIRIDCKFFFFRVNWWLEWSKFHDSRSFNVLGSTVSYVFLVVKGISDLEWFEINTFYYMNGPINAFIFLLLMIHTLNMIYYNSFSIFEGMFCTFQNSNDSMLWYLYVS